MANKSLFSSLKSRLLRAEVRNEAGGRAYQMSPKHALAQLAATGCFNGTYYTEAEEQLATLKTLIDQVDDKVFLAKLTIYSRQRAMMKDMPVALLLALSRRDTGLFRQVFDRVVDNGRTQGQRSLNGCSGKDLEQVFIVPATRAAFHGDAVFLRMLFQQG